jgi:co-chaperonin GroES (HSP10)
MTLKPLRNNVMFRFLDSTSGEKGAFTESTISGIILPTTKSTQKAHRWAQVVAAGPLAAVEPGDYILIESLMWMEAVKFEGEKMWKTDDSKVLAVTNDRSACQSQAL